MLPDWPIYLSLPLWFWIFTFPILVIVGLLVFEKRLSLLLGYIWNFLDRVYFFAGIIAAISMFVILVLIVAQMIARWTGIVFEGSTEFAGYTMASTSFFALAYALGQGSHIRVSILLNLNDFTKKWLDAFAIFISAEIATYFARYAVKTNFMSMILNDRTQGQDRVPEEVITFLSLIITSPMEWRSVWSASGSDWIFTPIWLPQIPMSIGTILLAICLWDHLLRLLIKGKSSIQRDIIK